MWYMMCCSFHSIFWGGMQCSPSAISRNSSLNSSGNYAFCSEPVAAPKTSCHGAYVIRCTYVAMECIRTVQQYATYYRHLHTNTLDYETNRIISEIVTWRVPLLRSIAAACFLGLFFYQNIFLLVLACVARSLQCCSHRGCASPCSKARDIRS